MVWPTRRGLPTPPDATPVLMIDTSGWGLSVGVVVEDGGEPVGRVVPGGTPLAVAVFVTAPAASFAAVSRVEVVRDAGPRIAACEGRIGARDRCDGRVGNADARQ